VAILRILIVEDEFIVATMIADVLRDMGHEVCDIEATEAGAVAAAIRCNPDMLIVDAQLRTGSGVSAVKEILRSGFVPHILMSGGQLRDVPLDRRAVVLQKPFRDSEFAQAIDKARKFGQGHA
jgi:DNA-binding response OmpR family regulator